MESSSKSNPQNPNGSIDNHLDDHVANVLDTIMSSSNLHYTIMEKESNFSTVYDAPSCISANYVYLSNLITWCIVCYSTNKMLFIP